MRFLLVLVAVLPLSLACEMVPDQLSQPGKAIIFGVGDYTNLAPDEDLVGPPYDVTNMSKALGKKGWQVTSRVNSAATSVQLQTDISNAVASLKAYEKLIVYFSGHGTPYDFSTFNEEAFLTVETDSSTTGFVTPSLLHTWIKPALDKKAIVIVIIDTCYSGGFVFNGDYQNTIPSNVSNFSYYMANRGGNAFGQALNRYFDNKESNANQGYGYEAENLWIMSAAGPGEVSWEAGSGGVFTKAFVTGLSKGDTNGDGFVTIYEAYRYAFNDIKNNWNIYSSYLQDIQFLPQIVGHNYDLSLVKL